MEADEVATLGLDLEVQPRHVVNHLERVAHGVGDGLRDCLVKRFRLIAEVV